MDQGTEQWLEWRKKGIGASDAGIIMGVSPWMTPFQLWEQKTGRKEHDQTSYATERGIRLEPKARAAYELLHDIDAPPTLMENKKIPWMRASLDGYNHEAGVVLEIKCPGEVAQAEAMSGKIPDKYFWQLQHQLMVSKAKEVHYYSFDGENGVLVKMFSDVENQKILYAKELEFWNYIQTDIAPPLSDRDEVEIISYEGLIATKRLKDAKVKMDKAKEELEEAKRYIGSLMEHSRCRAGGVLIVRKDDKLRFTFPKGGE